MIPLQDLLHRIRWDPEFGRGEFILGYYDRVERRILLVPLQEIEFPSGCPGVLERVDPEGRTHTLPLHRVREVYKNGELIWRR